MTTMTIPGVTLVTPTGFEMVTDVFPDDTTKLCESVQNGVRRHLYDKPQIFNPNEIQEPNFASGRHTSSPIGNIVVPPLMEVILLHYKYLGFDYVDSRFSTLQQIDIHSGYGAQYLWNEQGRLHLNKSLAFFNAYELIGCRMDFQSNAITNINTHQSYLKMFTCP